MSTFGVYLIKRNGADELKRSRFVIKRQSYNFFEQLVQLLTFYRLLQTDS